VNAVRFRRPDSFSIVAGAQVLRPVRSSVQSPGFRRKGPPRTIGGIGLKVPGDRNSSVVQTASPTSSPTRQSGNWLEFHLSPFRHLCPRLKIIAILKPLAFKA
jgi:hypothetical protein